MDECRRASSQERPKVCNVINTELSIPRRLQVVLRSRFTQPKYWAAALPALHVLEAELPEKHARHAEVVKWVRQGGRIGNGGPGKHSGGCGVCMSALRKTSVTRSEKFDSLFDSVNFGWLLHEFLERVLSVCELL